MNKSRNDLSIRTSRQVVGQGDELDRPTQGRAPLATRIPSYAVSGLGNDAASSAPSAQLIARS
jgi:hypothetical protein